MLLTEFDEERDYRIVAEGLAENIVEERCEELKKEGIKEGIKDMILTMLSNGVTKETILKQTSLSEEEYEKLIN